MRAVVLGVSLVGLASLVGLGGSLASASVDTAKPPVPILRPSGLTLTSPQTLIIESEYYALTSHVAGATIALQGTRTAHRYAGVGPVAGNRDVRGTKGFVSVNEGIRTVAWNEHGGAYSLDVECADARDLRCQNDEYVLAIVAGLR